MANKTKTAKSTRPARAKRSTPKARSATRAAARKTARPGINGKTASAAQTKPAVRPTPARPLSAKETAQQREQLELERVEVEKELNALRAELLEAPELTGDEVDLNVYEREKTLGLIAAYERRLEEIDAALRSAAKGTYGICERCGNPIDPERLKVFPEARLCITCKNEVEREQRRMGGR